MPVAGNMKITFYVEVKVKQLCCNVNCLKKKCLGMFQKLLVDRMKPAYQII